MMQLRRVSLDAAGGKPLDFLFDDSASGLFLDQLARPKSKSASRRKTV
jgi:hypothetical protein